jgi:hypothetical protein
VTDSNTTDLREPSTLGGSQGRAGGLPFRPYPPESLRALYLRYCEREAAELLALLPREGLRALIRAAGVRADDPDAMGSIRAVARDILPLPPYEAWLGSYLENRTPYLERLGVPAVPDRFEPVTVAVRPVGDAWWAQLNLHRTAHGWVGHILFHPDPEGESAHASMRRTGDIFRGPDPEEFRVRFLDFGRSAMDGFLRSASAIAPRTLPV